MNEQLAALLRFEKFIESHVDVITEYDNGEPMGDDAAIFLEYLRGVEQRLVAAEARPATATRARASVGELKFGRMDILTHRSGAIDVLTLATGQVLAVMRNGIELWPNLEAMLTADPGGDFAGMESFFEYACDCYVINDPCTQREPEELLSSRFGSLRRTVGRGIYICGVYARGDYTVVELHCGPALRIDDDGVSYWNSVQELVAAAEDKHHE